MNIKRIYQICQQTNIKKISYKQISHIIKQKNLCKKRSSRINPPLFCKQNLNLK